MEPHEPQLFNGIMLSEQDGSDRATCSAHSLTNLIRLAGGSVSPDEIIQLKTKIATGGKPLDTEFEEGFITSHGFVADNLFSFFQTEIPKPATIEGVSHGLISKLQQGPILISIASELSLRDRSIDTNTELSDKKADSHSVVVTLKDNTIDLIDPYKPYQTKKFNLNDDSQRLELVAWFTSTRARRTLVDSQMPIDKTHILNESREKLSDPKTSPIYIAEALSYTKPLLAHRKN